MEYKCGRGYAKIIVVQSEISGNVFIIFTHFLGYCISTAPPNKYLTKVNQMYVNFIWGTNYDIAKQQFLFHSKKNCGLDAVDLDLKLKIVFVKNIANGIQRTATW